MCVKNGSLVRFNYWIKVDDGRIASSSGSKLPVEARIGDGTIIKGIEEGIIGMKQSEKREINIPPEKAFGHRKKGFVKEVFRKDVGAEVKVGQSIKVKNSRGKIFEGKILEVGEEKVIIDFNPPLAGITLKLEIELLDIIE